MGTINRAMNLVTSAAPGLLGGPGRRRVRVRRGTKAQHGGSRGLIHPLPLPSQGGGMIGVDWIAGLQTTAGRFDMIQKHVDLLSESGKVHAVPTRATATAAMISGDYSRQVPSLLRRVSRHAVGRSRPQVHELLGVVIAQGLRQGCPSSAQRIARTPTPKSSGPTAP